MVVLSGKKYTFVSTESKNGLDVFQFAPRVEMSVEAWVDEGMFQTEEEKSLNSQLELSDMSQKSFTPLKVKKKEIKTNA